jgi:hypothetical protein
MSHGFTVWTIPSVIGVFVLMQILNVAADRIANDFISAEHGEP